MRQLVEIHVKGRIDEAWSEWFDGYKITNKEEGETMLSGPIRDQTALYSLISRLRDLGLALVSVKILDTEDNKDPAQTREDEMLSA